MRVLHVSASVSKVRGGTSKAILEMVRALQSAGVTAEIAATNDSGPDLLDVPLAQKVLYCQVPVYFFPRFSPSVRALREFAVSPTLFTWLWQNLHYYDLVHVHALFSMPCTLAMALAKYRGIPYVVSPHGLLCKWSLQQSALKKQTYLRLIERWNLNGSSGLHLNSYVEQDEVSALGLAAPSFVVPHGLQLSSYNSDARQKLRHWLHLPSDEPIILFLSRLHPKKGLDVLISALSQIRHTQFNFIIAGSGDPNYENEIRDCIQKSGIGDRTRMVGFIEGEQKDLLLQGSDLFALTSHSENFGLAVLEALAAGLPCIVTPGVALARLVKQERFGVVPELETRAISTAIHNCLNQPETTKEMGDRARQFILKNYTWEQISTKLIRTYQAVIENKTIPAFESSIYLENKLL